MLLGRSALTRLVLGHAAVVVPLLTVLAEMHSHAYKQGRLGAAGAPRQAGGCGAAPAAPTAPSDLLAGAAAASGVHQLQLQASPGQAPPAPPPLVLLSLVLTPNVSPGQLTAGLSAVCCLSQLTQLSLGWAQTKMDEFMFMQHEKLHPPVEVSVQQQLSKLGQLRSLALGWPAAPELLGALAGLAGLTALELGGLFTAQQQPRRPGAGPAPALAPLPSVRRLRVHAETTTRLRAGTPEPLRDARCLDALAAFPALTRLELTGRVYGEPLARLPTLAPAWRSGLLELLLPQRMGCVRSGHLAALKQLTALTHLRLGWRSTAHHGPAGYVPVSGQQGEEPQRLTVAALTSSSGTAGELTPGLTPAEVSAAAAEAGAGAALAVSSSSGAPAEALPAPAARCSTCGALPVPGCMCQLRSLEVVGPLPPWELEHVRSLPAVRHLVLRDNSSWATGTFVDTPQLYALFSSQLSRLELLHCEGVTAADLEGRWLRERPGRHNIGPQADLVVAPRAGLCAHELGRGFGPFMGCTLTAAEEEGLLPDEVPAWQRASSERLEPDDTGAAGALPHFADVGGVWVAPHHVLAAQAGPHNDLGDVNLLGDPVGLAL
jgi:hypothetical protein